MFTGIVEEVGTVVSVRKAPHSCVLAIAASKVLEDVHRGDSIATNGVCLTVTDFTRSGFSADVMPETLDRSSLGVLRPGSPVNLERAMLAGGRFGGHIVSGHIDGTGTVKGIDEDDNAVWYRIGCEPAVLRLVVEKGSIAIDGISLTDDKLDAESFSVSVIPHTRAQTNMAAKRVGDAVNLENDCIGKYVERLLTCSFGLAGDAVRQDAAATSRYVMKAQGRMVEKPSGITREFLLSNGF